MVQTSLRHISAQISHLQREHGPRIKAIHLMRYVSKITILPLNQLYIVYSWQIYCLKVAYSCRNMSQ